MQSIDICRTLLKRHNILDCCTGGLMRGTMAKMSSFTDNAENQRKGQGCRWWISILEFHHYIPPYTQSPFRQRKQGILMSPYMHLLGIASLCIHADEFGLEKECTIVNGVTARGQNRYNIKMSWITNQRKGSLQSHCMAKADCYLHNITYISHYEPNRFLLPSFDLGVSPTIFLSRQESSLHRRAIFCRKKHCLLLYHLHSLGWKHMLLAWLKMA